MSAITLEIKKRETRHEIESLRPQEIDGIRLCLNCNKPIPEGNQKYCSRKCCIEFFAKNNQQGLRKYVLEREHGICQICHCEISPVFKTPYPTKPQFSKHRPEEHTFPNYTKSNHRIANYENILITADREHTCSCGKAIVVGEECYCKHPDIKVNNCQFGCKKAVDKYKYKPENVCANAHVHCVECGLKAVKTIEKQWNKDHRKALADFKKAYKEWDAEYTTWVKSGVLQQYEEAKNQWEAKHEAWFKTVTFKSFVADHIIPIALGGPEFDLNNIQLLCEDCNKIKTAKDAANIARRRRDIKRGVNGCASLDSFQSVHAQKMRK